jgi:hypothetical protein
LFGKTRQGTRQIRLSLAEQNRLRDQGSQQAYQAQGGVIETNISGTRTWKLYGQFHRQDGPAVEWADGSREWWINGQWHREDGPAIERVGSQWTDGDKQWYCHGQRHRQDGPAIEWADGRQEYWLRGCAVSSLEVS